MYDIVKYIRKGIVDYNNMFIEKNIVYLGVCLYFIF